MNFSELRKAAAALRELEQNGFCVTYDRQNVTFSKYSPCGHDFFFSVSVLNCESLEEVARLVYEYYDGYDVSYEAYLWLDDTGHGKNGAPHDMKDVYDDMKACEGYIYHIYDILLNFA